jgi:hypothetical protein
VGLRTSDNQLFVAKMNKWWISMVNIIKNCFWFWMSIQSPFLIFFMHVLFITLTCL